MTPLLLVAALAVAAVAQTRAPELPAAAEFRRLMEESAVPRPAVPSPAGRDFFDVLQDNGIDAGLAARLPHRKMVVEILPADTDRYHNHSRTFPPEGPDGTCKIIVIHPSSPRAEMIHQNTTIPRKYVAPIDGPDYSFLRVLLHEATHCEQYDQEGSLAGEIRGDVFAARALMTLPGGAQEARRQKLSRAVRAMLGEGVSHALALSLDAQEGARPLPDPAAVSAAHLTLYEMLYAAGILDPAAHGYRYEEEGELLRAVYAFMKRALASGVLAGDALMRREAELYIEGLETLAPALLAAHPEDAALERVKDVLSRGGAVGAEDKAHLARWLPRFMAEGLVGREPTAAEKAEIHDWLPGLAARGDWRVSGEACRRYNCFAWAVGETGRTLHADGDYFAQFDEFFLRYGYVPVLPGRSQDEADIAVWAIGPDVTHAARHLTGDLWESKLGEDGPSVRALHRLGELDDGNYGRVAKFYRRASAPELSRLGAAPIAPNADLQGPCARSRGEARP